jgi:hypothetical protein
MIKLNFYYPFYRVETTPAKLIMGIRFSTLVECDNRSSAAATSGINFSAMECSFIPVKKVFSIKL